MLKYLSYIVSSLFLIVFSVGFSQQKYGNEWIDFSKEYYKIPVGEDGFYKLTYNDLINQNIPINTIDPRSLKLYFRGEECAIEVNGEQDGVFNPQDVVSFYGIKNRGGFEKEFSLADTVANPYYALYTDTTAFFLTWGGISGKRISKTGTPNTTLAISKFPIEEKLQVFTNNFSQGKEVISSVNRSEYDVGDGWMSGVITKNDSKPFHFTTTFQGVETNGELELEIRLVGRNRQEHKVEVLLNDNVSGVLDGFSQQEARTFKMPVNASDIQGGVLDVKLKMLGVNGNAEAVSIAYIKLTHAVSELDNDGSTYSVQSSSEDIQFSAVSNISTEVYDISDIHNVKKLTTILSSNKLFLKLGILGERTIRLKGVDKVASLSKTVFSEDLAADFLIVSNKRYQSSVDAYGEYRKSGPGGGFNVSKAYVSRLFDQYGYGEKTPFAINNFCRFMYDNFKSDYLLLIGKPSELRNVQEGKSIRVEPNALGSNGEPLFEDYLMTAGQPGSDYLYTMGLNPQEPYVQAIATGRVSAYNNQEVFNYLDKVKEYEQIGSGQEWQKRFVHLSGGKTAFEQRLFKDYIDSYANTVKGKLVGGESAQFYKESNQELIFFNVSEEVNKGAAFITYIGHSAPNFIEIDIGKVTNEAHGYNNKGKYPFLIFNGCQAGFIFFSESTIENWMHAQNKGAIGGMAHTAYGFTSRLHKYTEIFYDTYFTDSTYFEESIGNVLKEVARKMSVNPSSINDIDITHLQQFIYLGDPAIKYFPAKQPDFTLNIGDVSVVKSNETITAVSDSFQLEIIVNNIGRAVDDSIDVCISRVYDEGGKTIVLPRVAIQTPYLRDTIYVTIYNDADDFVGNNSFVVSLDCGGRITELNELNNSQVFDYYLPSNGVFLRNPFQFEVVGKDTVTLLVESSDRAITSDIVYEIQVDTNYDFSAPIKNVQLTGGLAVSEKVTLPYLIDSTVYFWRSRIVSGITPIWVESSFMYIKDKKGWGQGHAHQFRNNSLNGISIPDKQWVFNAVETEIKVTSSGDSVSDYFKNVKLLVNNQAMMVEATATWNDFCIKNGVYALTFDRQSGLPYHYDALGRCGFAPRVMDNFSMTSLGDRARFNKYIENTNNGDGILLYTGGNAKYSLWEDSLKTKLKALGALEIDSVKDGEPYMLLVKKGEGLIFEKRGVARNVTLNETMVFSGIQGDASVLTPVIGPVNTASKLIAQAQLQSTDSIEYLIESVPNGFEKNYLENNTYETDDYNEGDFSSVSLTWKAKDTVLTAPQLKRWVLLFDPVAEGVLIPYGSFVNKYKTQQGDTTVILAQFINVSDHDFSDSISCVLQVIGGENVQQFELVQRYSLLKAGDTILLSYKIPTESLSGIYSISLEANSTRVVEQSYQNNKLVYQLEVEKDKINPLLDITFDGRYILSGDIVSPSPLVIVSMRDENKMLYKSDTTGWALSLKKVCEGCDFEPIYFSSEEVKSWTPASSSNDFRVEMKFNELTDGEYVLKVQGSDESGNRASRVPVEMRFSVVNESAVTHFYPYPNPFSTNCKFVFTLTGSEIPQKLLIRIMTVSGIVVRELNQDDLGGLHIGNNITPYAWDGTDQYGDRLANGVYLYQVLIDGKDDDSFKHRETSADKAFHRGWGKLYILR